MPLTPADVHNISFRKPPIGKRGYDQEQVDAFLDEVGEELIRLIEENGGLHDQVQRHGPGPATRGEPAQAAPSEASLSEAVARLERMRGMRHRAEHHARGLQIELDRARSEASAPAAPPAGGGDRVLTMAQRTADEHMRDARQESEVVLSEAREEAERITGEARLEAGAIEGDARRDHAEAMDDLAARRAALLDEIDRLGRLAQGYQAALAGHISARLDHANGRPDPSPADSD